MAAALGPEASAVALWDPLEVLQACLQILLHLPSGQQDLAGLQGARGTLFPFAFGASVLTGGWRPPLGFKDWCVHL